MHKKIINRFLIALQFLTIFPIKKNLYTSEKELGDSMFFFPFVGALQGGLLAVADFFLLDIFPLPVVSALLLIILFLTNFGLHLDGFMDTLDGLAGGTTKESRLLIMKDSRVGAIGAVSVFLLFLLKFSSITALDGSSRTCVLFLFPIIGRLSIIAMATGTRYARDGSGLGLVFSNKNQSTLFFTSAIVTIPTSILLGLKGVLALLTTLVVTYFFTLFFTKKLGGITGDTFGFQTEVSEALFILLMIAIFL
ncbi:MAG: adenosylcobinamide-GDP ribazoletransferase [Deltaproteobacteria bacterium]|nr:adenosylcobinamide-GDP ribazoletransferase [Deltaproteobacteria bacterium]